MKFKPSEQQLDVFDFVKYGYGNAVISAVAGSGKTTTIIKALEYIKPNRKVLFLAFNRSIVEELRSRITRENTYIMTTHSLGYSMIRNKYRGKEISIDEKKYVKQAIEMGYESKDVRYLKNIERLCDFSRFYLAKNKEEIENVASKFGITPLDDEINIAYELLEWGKNSLSEDNLVIDYTDMIYLPNALNLRAIKYDFIIIDEAQDLSISQMNLFEKCIKMGSRFIAVGDENQSINGFAGSDMESFNNLKDKPNTITLPLSTSYRCPVNVVKFAQKIYDGIKASEHAELGFINMNANINDIKDGDMIICRYIEPLTTLYIKLITNNIKCFINGSDIGENLINIVSFTKSNELHGENGLLNEIVNELIKFGQINGTDSIDYDNKKEQYNVIKILSNNLKSKDELINKIRMIFVDNEKEGIMLSTIHRSKGLEADNVYILNSYLTPSKYAKCAWEMTQERNLMYVSYTRSKKILGFLNIEL